MYCVEYRTELSELEANRIVLIRVVSFLSSNFTLLFTLYSQNERNFRKKTIFHVSQVSDKFYSVNMFVYTVDTDMHTKSYELSI